MRTIKQKYFAKRALKSLTALRVMAAIGLTSIFIGTSSVAFALPAIPAGCPGSTQTTTTVPAVCATIPAGCPGTTLQGPASVDEECPYAAAQPGATTSTTTGGTVTEGKYHCGQYNSDATKNEAVTTSIDFGCTGKGNAITDITFAIIRVLSDGVGLVVVASLVYAGIMYTLSRGDPQATAKAIGRMRSSIIALIVFIFGYAILNYVIPAGFFK
jgi:hypothetical protein